MLPTLAVLALPVVAAAQVPEQPGDPTRGAELAQSFCSGCHVIGPQQNGPAQNGAPSFLALAKKTDASSEVLFQKFQNDQHPPLPNPLNRQQARDIVAYIRSLVTPAKP